MDYMIKNFEVTKLNPNEIPSRKGLVYEVVRIIDGVPLFLKGHYHRLINSLKASSSKMELSFEKYKSAFDSLISTEEKENYNLKTIIDPISHDFFLFESPSSYPEAKLYSKGIDTVTMKFERNNPNSKIINTDLTSRARILMESTQSYEVILVDSEGFITEGSRSNIFFHKDSVFYTPPVESVLPGITRLKIIETLKKYDIELKEIKISEKEIGNFDGAFMTGTSPKMLPIRKINSHKYSIQDKKIIAIVINAFNETIENDIKNYSK